jgi:glycolate oxidase iron-sulfur subunit
VAGLTTLTDKCAKCGSCAQVCPVYLETGRESHCARGKLHLFKTSPDYSSGYFNSLLAKCIQCGACDDICPRDLQPSLLIRTLRSKQTIEQTSKGYSSFVARQIVNHSSLLTLSSASLAALSALPLASGLRQKINILNNHQNDTIPQPETSATTPLLYFPGCLAHHFQTDIEQATRYLAGLGGYNLIIPNQATCCGIASDSSGKHTEAQKQALKNIKAYSDNTQPVLTSCGSCYAQLKSYPHLFAEKSAEHKAAQSFAERVQEFSTFFLNENKLKGCPAPQPVYYHDPCHLRFSTQPIINEPRQLIRNLTGQTVVNTNESLGCCGQGGLFELTNPDLAKNIFKRVKKQITATSPATVVTTCSSCLLGWQQGVENTIISARHLSVFLAKICENC